jgi:hypothetical protein
VQIRDRLGEWMGDEDFAAAFGTRGRPGWYPSRLALVTVLQRAENLTDRPTAEAVRTRMCAPIASPQPATAGAGRWRPSWVSASTPWIRLSR